MARSRQEPGEQAGGKHGSGLRFGQGPPRGAALLRSKARHVTGGLLRASSDVDPAPAALLTSSRDPDLAPLRRPGGGRLCPAAPAVEILPLDAVRPGMTGVGRTVFEGSRIEEFRVTVLGVLENVGPPPELDPGSPGGRTAGAHGRHRRDERQPGLHRRPAGGRRLLRLPVLQGDHRRDHADRRDVRGHADRSAAGGLGTLPDRAVVQRPCLAPRPRVADGRSAAGPCPRSRPPRGREGPCPPRWRASP